MKTDREEILKNVVNAFHSPFPYLDPFRCLQQLAISFLNYDEIEVFDLEGVLPNREAIPVITLAPGSGPIRRTGSSDWQPYSRGFRSSRGHVGSTVGVSGVNGGVRGLGHLAFEFVVRGTPQSRVIHVVAGGREGTFRAWRIGASSMGKITPYLQVIGSLRSHTALPRADHVCMRTNSRYLCLQSPVRASRFTFPVRNTVHVDVDMVPGA